MADYKLSAQAEARIGDIYEASITSFGIAQAQRYLSGMHDAFERLTRFPSSGQSCDDLRTGLRRLHYGSHTIYYRKDGRDIFVLDVLHQSMIPANYLPPED